MSEELKKLEKLLANDRKIIEENYKEIERLGNELQIQIEDNSRLNEYIEEQSQQLQQKENIIKEVREYIEEHTTYEKYGYIDEIQLIDLDFSIKDLKQILDKGE